MTTKIYKLGKNSHRLVCGVVVRTAAPAPGVHMNTESTTTHLHIRVAYYYYGRRIERAHLYYYIYTYIAYSIFMFERDDRTQPARGART